MSMRLFNFLFCFVFVSFDINADTIIKSESVRIPEEEFFSYAENYIESADVIMVCKVELDEEKKMAKHKCVEIIKGNYITSSFKLEDTVVAETTFMKSDEISSQSLIFCEYRKSSESFKIIEIFYDASEDYKRRGLKPIIKLFDKKYIVEYLKKTEKKSAQVESKCVGKGSPIRSSR